MLLKVSTNSHKKAAGEKPSKEWKIRPQMHFMIMFHKFTKNFNDF